MTFKFELVFIRVISDSSSSSSLLFESTFQVHCSENPQTQLRLEFVYTCSLHWHTKYDAVCTSTYFHVIRLCCVWQANSKNSSGCIQLDINRDLLKPTGSRVEFLQAPAPLLSVPDRDASSPKWLEYVYRTVHPVLRCQWLPTKLAEWIGKNLQEELGFPDKADKRAEPPGTGWRLGAQPYLAKSCRAWSLELEPP